VDYFRIVILFTHKDHCALFTDVAVWGLVNEYMSPQKISRIQFKIKESMISDSISVPIAKTSGASTSAIAKAFCLFQFAAVFLASSASAQARYPPGCTEATFPNNEECIAKNWYLGPDARDPCAAIGPYPVSGEQVYLEDATNFCLLLPNPDSPHLKSMVYGGGLLPTILQGEGYARAFCMGSYMTPGM
jgi:hypothetical protein